MASRSSHTSTSKSAEKEFSQKRPIKRFPRRSDENLDDVFRRAIWRGRDSYHDVGSVDKKS